MPDLHDLPADVQLQIYDLFLALRTYQRQCRLDTICAMIKDGINKDDYVIKLSSVAKINVDEIFVYRDGMQWDPKVDEMVWNSDVEEPLNSLPEVILNGYKLMENLIMKEQWVGINASLTRCSISLDDGEADIQVWRYCNWGEYGDWDALYDIHTFKYIMCIRNSEDMDFKNDDMVEAMKHSIEYICGIFGGSVKGWLRMILGEGEEEYGEYCQLLNEASEKNYATTTFSDDFTKLRSVLDERFSILD